MLIYYNKSDLPREMFSDGSGEKGEGWVLVLMIRICDLNINKLKSFISWMFKNWLITYLVLLNTITSVKLIIKICINFSLSHVNSSSCPPKYKSYVQCIWTPLTPTLETPVLLQQRTSGAAPKKVLFKIKFYYIKCAQNSSLRRRTVQKERQKWK